MDMLISPEIVMVDCNAHTQNVEMTLVYDQCQKNSRTAAKCAFMLRHTMNEINSKAFHRLRETDFVAPRPRKSSQIGCNVSLTLKRVLVSALLNPYLNIAEIRET